MYSNHIEEIILPNGTNFTHTIFDDLVKSKISILKGRGAEYNKYVLKNIAMNGHLLPYDVFNNLKQKCIFDKLYYPTVLRRIKDLEKKGYLAEAGKRITTRGKQTEEATYGLTWRGFIASLSIDDVSEKLIQVIRKNPLLSLPEKESLLLILDEILTPDELAIFSKSLLEAYLRVIPNLELIRDDQLLIWFLAINKFPQFQFSRIPENGWELLDKPAILNFVKDKIVPFIRQKTEELSSLYLIFRALNELSEFIIGLDEKDKPSKKIKEYLENQLPTQFSDEQYNEIEKGVKS